MQFTQILPVEGEAHHRDQEDDEHHAGTDDDGDADHDGGVPQLLLPHGGHQDSVTVTGNNQGVNLRQILVFKLKLSTKSLTDRKDCTKFCFCFKLKLKNSLPVQYLPPTRFPGR